MRRFVGEMKRGDTIYVKDGKRIVGKGNIVRPYRYSANKRVRDPHGSYWYHQIRVEWEQGFQPITVLLGAEQFTVMPLTATQVNILAQKARETAGRTKAQEVMEGKLIKAEAAFRSRNRAVITAKKSISDGKCEVCGFDFSNRYQIDKDCLVAHHKIPIGQRKGASKTTVEDIALICPNCHAVAHTQMPPLKLERIKRMLI